MTRIAVLAAVAVAGCGSSGPKPPCMVLSNGNQLCGNAAVAWCQLHNVGLNGVNTPDPSTYQACVAASNWQSRGQKVINVSPSSNGTSLNETTTTTP